MSPSRSSGDPRARRPSGEGKRSSTGRLRRGLAYRLRTLGSFLGDELPLEPATLIREALQQIAELFQTERAMVLFEAHDEPWLHLARVFRGEFEMRSDPPTELGEVVHSSLDSLPFHLADCDSDRVLVQGPAARSRRSVTAPVQKAFCERHSIRRALVLPISGEIIQGHLFLLDVPEPDRESFMAAILAADVFVSRFEHSSRMVESRDDAVRKERVRVARDLHDGLLQSFTGVVLQLETVHELLERNPGEARSLLTQTEGMIMADQRDLRFYVEQLRPQPRRVEREFDLQAQIEQLRERYRIQWGLETELSFGSIDPLVAKSLGWETYRIITEALTNAVRHGQATHARVEISSGNDRLAVVVDDNGCGFPFRGRHSLAELTEMHQAPSTLGERVTALNGDVTVESRDTGSRLEISIPLGYRGD
ncbi:MAG: histidine kinase [Thermoanaerobaculia bacterium]